MLERELNPSLVIENPLILQDKQHVITCSAFDCLQTLSVTLDLASSLLAPKYCIFVEKREKKDWNYKHISCLKKRGYLFVFMTWISNALYKITKRY